MLGLLGFVVRAQGRAVGRVLLGRRDAGVSAPGVAGGDCRGGDEVAARVSVGRVGGGLAARVAVSRVGTRSVVRWAVGLVGGGSVAGVAVSRVGTRSVVRVAAGRVGTESDAGMVLDRAGSESPAGLALDLAGTESAARAAVDLRHDGLLDITSGLDLVTVSWSRFAGHDKAMLSGNSDSATGDRGKLRVTPHHCDSGSERDLAADVGRTPTLHTKIDSAAGRMQ